MQIRRFRAPDMRQAIRKVRDAVGPDAVILSNQRLPTGEIEIVEESLSIRNNDSAKQLRDMELELKNVRAMLEQRQQAESRAEPKENIIESRAREKLKGLGLSEFVVSRLIDDIDLKGREDDWNRLLAHLADYIPVRSSSSELKGCIAFMGPTGVGKTTSIGKIAAQHVLKHGSDGVVLITTDSYRIAAHEQLRTFGRILNVPVEVVNEYSDLNEVLAKYAHYSLVLVDTAGMNPRDSNLERQLLMMKRARASLKKLLVLPCTSQRQVLKTVVDVYSQIQLDGCVLSKLDESASLGEAISVVIEEGLPVVYIADGQRIPDDIEPARAHNLISRAVYTAEHYSQLYGSLKYGS